MYIAMFLHQNAGKDHILIIDNKSFENVAKFRYLGARATNQNYIHEEMKSRLNLGIQFHSQSFIFPSSL